MAPATQALAPRFMQVGRADNVLFAQNCREIALSLYKSFVCSCICAIFKQRVGGCASPRVWSFLPAWLLISQNPAPPHSWMTPPKQSMAEKVRGAQDDRA